MPEGGAPSLRWFHQWWGVAGIALGALVAGVILVEIGLTAYYWWAIAHGRGGQIAEKLSGRFTFSPEPAGGARAQNIDRAAVETADDPARGAPGAALTVVEFIDFKCPNCEAAAPIMEEVISKYGGKVRFIARDFPVETLHPGATELAELAWCAGDQGRYWQAHDWLFANQDGLSVPIAEGEVARLVQAASLNPERLSACRTGGRATREVRSDYFDGIRFGVRGTPTFFLNGKKVEGVIPLSWWQRALSTSP